MTAFAYLALAARIGAAAPTAAVQAEPARMAQWTARLLRAGTVANRCGTTADEIAATITEANLYTGHPQPPRLWPAPMPVPRVLPGMLAHAASAGARP